ncbi:helix-turn-helix domain-containing protein [Nocardia wallacei]|uniref:helix-turn-helix domain-containing protein n=1 Tax=Nocardia wallacei TaxID=480035 RepID=UPI0024580E4B|nr:helix-turn-helix transcriptional regulator [Nocardia wallacei]
MARPDRIYEALGFVTWRHRDLARKTQPDVYKAAALTRNTYIRLEKGQGPFTAEQIAAIATVYGLEDWELLREARDALKRGEVPDPPQRGSAWKKAFGFKP